MATNNGLNLSLSGQTGTGNIVGANTPTLITPVLGAATATSVNFGGTTLSHYDEGTFMPTITCGTPGDLAVVYAAQLGSYTRVGRLVFVNVLLAFTPTYTTASGALRIDSLPFTILQDAGGSLNYLAGATPPVWPATHTSISVYGNGGTTYCTLATFGSAQNESDVLITGVTSTTQSNVQFSITYQI